MIHSDTATVVRGQHPAKVIEVIHLIKDLVNYPELLPCGYPGDYLGGIGG